MKSNRIAEPLQFLTIFVDHADGTYQSCPNGMVGCAIWAADGQMPDFGANGLMPGSTLFNILDLRPVPLLPSAISSEPAVMYRADDLEIAMTPEELLRFACHDLEPEEFFALMEKYGEFHEIHDDFYDPDTGEAWQPILVEQRRTIHVRH